MRLFTALPLNDNLCDAFPALFGVPISGVRLARRAELHLTLQFVGDVEQESAEALAEELAAVRVGPFQINLDGVGCFEGMSKHRILYVDVKRSEPLLDLHARIGRAIEAAGMTKEDRPYNPHVTLARVKTAATHVVQPFLNAHADYCSTTPATRFILYQVHRRSDSQHYEPWREYPLRVA